MVKKYIGVSVALALAAALTVSCSGGGAGSGGGPEGSTPKPEAKSGEPVEITVVSTSGDSVESWDQRFGNMLKQKFPNYSIKYVPSTKQYGIKEMMVAGEPMDMYFDSISFLTGGLLGNSLQYDMTDLIKRSNLDFGSFEPSVVDAMKQLAGGKMYGVPVFNNNVVLYYNKDIFDKSGAPYPKDGMTWDEFTELMKKIIHTDGTNKQYVGYATSGTHVFRMNQLSLPYVDAKTEKATINSESWKKFIETVFVAPQLAGGYKDFVAARQAGPYTNEFFKTQEVATFALLSSSMLVEKSFETMNWDLVALPTFKDQPGVGSQGYPTYFSVTTNSRHKEEVMEIIKYLLSEEAQLRLSKMGVMTVLKNEEIRKAFGQESRYKDKNLKAVFYNQFAPIPYKSIYDPSLESPYTKAVGAAMDTGDINTALRTAEEDANKRIQDAKAK